MKETDKSVMPSRFFKGTFGFFLSIECVKQIGSCFLAHSINSFTQQFLNSHSLLDSLSSCQLRLCLPFRSVSASLLLFSHTQRYTHTHMYIHMYKYTHTVSPWTRTQHSPRESLNAPVYALGLGSVLPTTPGSSKIPVSE